MSTVQHRAVEALVSTLAMRLLLGQARHHRIPGAWSGAALRSYPRGLAVGRFKLTAHCDPFENHADIRYTEADGWNVNAISQDPQAHGDAHPRPLAGGRDILIWRNGRWLNRELEVAHGARVLAILSAAAARIAVLEEGFEGGADLRGHEHGVPA